eukprot:CAMPEP_0184726850 /NCGR_PEP_ID=MMETSP0314-20130426/34854_1 /TAXON_ID=38298 /ORGANISM="Rhodella maculata, Strain CCMP 736" /LENGTH=68 /DNA_ID=CAMNT_0027192349 /DNA_START=109 /DNA_END=315 /DNA_ORIENTATION=+
MAPPVPDSARKRVFLPSRIASGLGLPHQRQNKKGQCFFEAEFHRDESCFAYLCGATGGAPGAKQNPPG